ncbi:hypothetical protein GCM10027343_37240 [Noviherbaspirillum agri]
MAIHFILQGKGGVGKSLIAAFLTQYLQSKNESVYCADTDPVNQTFSRYAAFGADPIAILNNESQIDSRKFDRLIEKLLEHNGHAVIDNGAATFVPLSAYLSDSGIMPALADAGKKVIIHSVLTGGQGLNDTLIGLNALLRTQEAAIVVWENEFFGKVLKNDKTFVESELFQKYKSRILGVVKVEKRTADTFGKDMELLISNNLTFEQAKTSDLFTFVPRSRLRQVQKSIFEQLDQLSL